MVKNWKMHVCHVYSVQDREAGGGGEEIALFASITKTAVVAVAGDTTMGPSSRDNGQLPEAIFPNDFV